MDRHIAFVFKSAPHGSSSGREGLDALLATSVLTENIGVFFISDGVFQIVNGQRPNLILARDHVVTFKLLSIVCKIKIIRACSNSLQERGISEDNIFIIKDIKVLSSSELRSELDQFHIILTF